ncbi:MAG: hypothetical protein ACXQTT_03580 [Candidatus Syntropharchaeia archaeon]
MEVMRMRAWFMKTSDSSRIVAIVMPPSDQYLDRATMDDIRGFVKSHSLRLRDLEVLYTYAYRCDELSEEEKEEWEEFILSLKEEGWR